MSIEVLISTMNLPTYKDHKKLIEKMKVKSKTLTINQITKNDIGLSNEIDSKHRLISVYDKGLSKSRNLAIDNAAGDVIVIADDDIEYVSDYEEIIFDAYSSNPEADVIIFYVESTTKERPLKRIPSGMIDFEKSKSVCSVRITFKKESLTKNGIKFDTNFGSGAKFNAGEDNIIICECLRKGLKVISVDKLIAYVDMSTSTWFTGYDEHYFHVKGACFYAMALDNYYELILDFAKRKEELYIDNFSHEDVINFMKNGVNEYISLLNCNKGE